MSLYGNPDSVTQDNTQTLSRALSVRNYFLSESIIDVHV